MLSLYWVDRTFYSAIPEMSWANVVENMAIVL